MVGLHSYFLLSARYRFVEFFARHNVFRNDVWPTLHGCRNTDNQVRPRLRQRQGSIFVLFRLVVFVRPELGLHHLTYTALGDFFLQLGNGLFYGH